MIPGESLESLFNRLEALAAERGAVLYNILHRQAGWGIEWWEESRCMTPEPSLAGSSPTDYGDFLLWLQAASRVNDARLSEGRIVYAYRPTLREAIEAEIERLEKK